MISTSLFIPFEIYEGVKHFTALKLLTLIVNIAIVAYLIWLLRTQRSSADATPARRA